MEYAVKIVPQARQELEDIAYFIALDNPAKARSFVKELVTSISNTLSTLPESGVIYKSYTAFYRVKKEEKLVEILHLVNLTKPLSERDIIL
jgi:plasmid stabilization system protein ParE